MTVSEKEIYYMDYKRNKSYNNYNYGSEAYDYDIEIRENRPVKKRKPVAEAEEKGGLGHSLFLALAAGVFFFGCVITITAVSSVSEIRYKITELKSELNAIQNENIVLSSEISDTINLDYIESRAVNELGMTEPQDYQIRTISVPEQSYTIRYSDNTESTPEVNAELLKEFFFKG